MESRLKGQIDSPVFENLVDLLKTKAWPEETFENFGDMKLQILGDHFWEIILKRNCEINFINAERQVLISFLLPFIKDYKPAILLKVTLIHGYFSRFLNCTNGTKSRNASHMKMSKCVTCVQNIIFHAIYKCWIGKLRMSRTRSNWRKALV